MRLEQITFTRFIAALAIVFYHFGRKVYPFGIKWSMGNILRFKASEKLIKKIVFQFQENLHLIYWCKLTQTKYKTPLITIFYL